MFCQSCGKPIPEDSKFCPECGALQEDISPSPVHIEPKQVNNTSKHQYSAPTPVPVVQQPNNASRSLSEEDLAKIKKRNKMLAIVVASALGLCLIIGLASTFIKPAINLNKYLTVSFEGYDTVGKAVVTFDEEKFERDYEKKLSAIEKKKTKSLSKKKNEEDYYDSLLESYDTSSASGKFLSKCVGGELSKQDGLSNGDQVTFTWKCDDEYVLEQYGYKLKYKDEEYTVEGLEEAETFDPFDGIEIIFSGISPDGKAEVTGEPKAAAAREFRYELDNRSGLSNGEKVTLTCTLYYDDPIEYCISNFGVIPASLSKEYTVDGLDSYVTKASEISPECIDQMCRQAEDVYNANVAKNWKSEEEKLKGFTYIGNYLLTNKSTDNYWGNYNTLYMVYKVNVKNSYSDKGKSYNETNEFYWFISYGNLLVNTSGVNTVDITRYDTPNNRFEIDSGISSGWFGTKSWYYYGYPTLEELYNAVVTYNLENYNHEDNVDASIMAAETIEEEDEEEEIGEAGVIFPDSSESVLDESEVKELSDEDLRYAINELYARHGYIFNDEELKEYYSQFEWYEETVKSGDFTMDMFNDVEKENVQMLQKERERRK